MLNCDSYAQLTDEGWLHLDLNPHLGVELRISPWSEGLRLYHRLAEHPHWSPLPHEDPDLLLVAPSPRTAVMANFLDSIPQAVCERVMPFGYRQFPLLRWLALLEEARALLEHHPVLLWLTVDLAQDEGWDCDTMRDWLRQPLTTLLQAAVGVNSRAALRFLRKTVVINGDRRELESLRRGLRGTHAVQACRHFDDVAVALVQVIERYPDLSHNGVLLHLNEVARESRPAALLAKAKTCSRLLEELEYMGRGLNIPNLTRLLHRCRAVGQLQRYHDRWTERVNHDLLAQPEAQSLLTRDTLPNTVFPDPPLPDSATIQAIRNARELRAEGREMNHCVGSYGQPIVSGRLAIYRVLAPERGTLALSGSGGNLRIREFHLSHNRQPSKASWLAVRAWIKHYRPDC